MNATDARPFGPIGVSAHRKQRYARLKKVVVGITVTLSTAISVALIGAVVALF